MPHSYHSDMQNPWSIYWIHVSGLKSGNYSRFASQTMAIDRGRSSLISGRTDMFSEIFRNLDRGFSIETLEYVKEK